MKDEGWRWWCWKIDSERLSRGFGDGRTVEQTFVIVDSRLKNVSVDSKIKLSTWRFQLQHGHVYKTEKIQNTWEIYLTSKHGYKHFRDYTWILHNWMLNVTIIGQWILTSCYVVFISVSLIHHNPIRYSYSKLTIEHLYPYKCNYFYAI